MCVHSYQIFEDMCAHDIVCHKIYRVFYKKQMSITKGISSRGDLGVGRSKYKNPFSWIQYIPLSFIPRYWNFEQNQLEYLLHICWAS